ncbi:MAG: hypothetical protein JWP00_3719 [Chloroflexi bacterium]|nr:hypothetical protein [Chloroflexota bacterium]
MTEQARPFKNIHNRVETLGTNPASVTGHPDSATAGETDQTVYVAPETASPRRSVLDSLIASGWLSWEKVFWVAIIVLAIVTRLWDLAPRAMHHDESIHGVFSYDMFKGKNVYRYDPTWHGPVLYYMVSLSYFLLGGATEFSARFAPAVFGIGMIALCWFLRPLLGKVGAIALALMILISPSIMYYSRSLRHDTFATCGMLLFVIGLFRYAQHRDQRKIGWMAAAGLGFFILFGSHEMSFLNLAIVLSWLGIIFLLELVVLPAWVRRPFQGNRKSEKEPAAPVIEPARPVETAYRRPLDEDDEMDEPVHPAQTVHQARFEELDGNEKVIPAGTTAKPLADTAELPIAAGEPGEPLEDTTAPVAMPPYTPELERTDPLLGDFQKTWYGMFGILALMVITGAIHLFSDRTYEGSIQQLLGVNAYLILLPLYLLLAALAAYPLARLVNLGYNRLSVRSNRLARFTALGIFVALAAAATVLFLRGKSPAAYLTALNLQVSGTSNAVLNKEVSDGFSGFNQVSYFALKWPSIVPQLVVIVIVSLLAGALVGWVKERGLLIYTRKGRMGFGVSALAVFTLAALISLRFIMVADRSQLPKVVLPLVGLVDKWLGYVLGGAVLAVIIGFVAGWFVSMAQRIPDQAVRGSAVFRTLLKSARNPWSIAALLLGFGIIYVLIFSNFFFAPERLADGFYRGIEYWLEQHGKRRLDEPWFYYPMLMLLYETFAVVCTFIALIYFPVVFFRRTARRGRFVFTVKGVFIGLTFWWTFLALMMYSIAGEKIPWLNMQITLPASMATAAFLNDYLRSVNWKRLLSWKEGLLFGGLFSLMFISTLVLIGMAINFPRVGQDNAGFGRAATTADQTLTIAQMVLVGLLGLTLFGVSLWLWKNNRLEGRVARAAIGIIFGIILIAYCFKSSIALNFEHPDTAIEPMIYTQTTPEVPLFVARLDRLSRDLRDIYKIVPPQTQPGQAPAIYPDPSNSKGLPVFMSTEVAWPLAWYFRDFTNVTQLAINTDANNPNAIDRLTDTRGNNFVVVLVSADESNNIKLQQQLQGQYTAQRFRFRWHFPEDDTGYGALGFDPPDDPREERIAKKDIINTRWDLMWRSLTQQPHAGHLWRYIMFRELAQPLQSFDMVAYVRNDVYPDFALTNGTSPTGTVTDPGTAGQTSFDLTSSTQAGNRDGQYRTPRNVTIASNGDILVLDSLNGRVQRFDSTGKFLSKFGSIGTGDGQFTLAQFQSGPGGITTDDEGNIYVADTWGYRIQKFDKDGKFLLKWGSGKDTQGNPDISSQFPTGFYGPRSIAFGAATGELYITDTGNRRVVVYDKQGQFKRQFGSTGTGQVQFNEPIGLAIGPDRNLYVADMRNKRVQVLDTQGTYIREIAVPTWKEAVLSEPYLAFDPAGDLWVSDPPNGAVLHFDKAGTLVSTYNAASGLNVLNPVGLTFSTDGTLYIADATRNSIVKFKP